MKRRLHRRLNVCKYPTVYFSSAHITCTTTTRHVNCKSKCKALIISPIWHHHLVEKLWFLRSCGGVFPCECVLCVLCVFLWTTPWVPMCRHNVSHSSALGTRQTFSPNLLSFDLLDYYVFYYYYYYSVVYRIVSLRRWLWQSHLKTQHCRWQKIEPSYRFSVCRVLLFIWSSNTMGKNIYMYEAIKLATTTNDKDRQTHTDTHSARTKHW